MKKYEIGYYYSNNFIYFVLQAMILATSGYLVVTNKLTYALFIVIESYIIIF